MECLWRVFENEVAYGFSKQFRIPHGQFMGGRIDEVSYISETINFCPVEPKTKTQESQNDEGVEQEITSEHSVLDEEEAPVIDRLMVGEFFLENLSSSDFVKADDC